MEPPSSELVRTLRELKLCGPIELRQASRLVRTLAADLPTFDSVWIDALVQLRCLTLFQAKVLTEACQQGLRRGAHVVIDNVGQDNWYEHCIGRSLESGQTELVTSLDVSGLNHAATWERVAALIVALKKLDHRFLVCPTQGEIVEQRLFMVTELVEGRDLRELMTRRGRWKPQLVRDLAAQLATGLLALERAGLCHGDIRLETVRLSQRGVGRLLLPGVLNAVHPELTIHADFSPECTECLAPERVGLGAVASPRGDQYSLGCLMWHLLTGRPPFLSADPLTKLARHKTGHLPDVREYAPDTPDALWHIILRLTNRDPEQRYANWDEVLTELGHATLASQHRLRRFVGELERPAVTARDWSELGHIAKRWTKITAVILLVAFVAIWFPANRSYLLSIAGSLQDETQTDELRGAGTTSTPQAASDTASVSEAEAPPYPLPQPDADGVVILHGSGPWRAGPLKADGTLTIQVAAETAGMIIVEDEPLSLDASAVRLENVVVQRADNVSPSGAVVPLIATTAADLQIAHCALIDLYSHQPMVWVNGESTATSTSSRIDCQDTFLVSQGSAFMTDRPLDAMEMAHLLRMGGGPLLESTSTSGAALQLMRLSHVTVRQAGPLWRLPAGVCNVTLRADDCVLDFAAGGTWLEFVGVGTPADWPAQIEITGQGTLTTPGTIVGTRFSRNLPVTKVDESAVLIDGIFGGEFEFAGRASLRPQDYALREFVADAPRQSADDPGVDTSRILTPPATPIRTGELE